MKQAVLFLLASIALNGCISSLEVVQHFGERVTIVYGGNTYEAELLEVSDSTLYLLSNDRLLLVPNVEVSSLEVPGFSLREAKLGPALTVAGLEVTALAIALAGDVRFKDASLPVFLFVFPPTLAALAYYTGEEVVNFVPPFDANVREKLRLYSRHPHGLSPAQHQQLLEYHGQKDFQRLGDVSRADGE
jgi:hypothetical protein